MVAYDEEEAAGEVKGWKKETVADILELDHGVKPKKLRHGWDVSWNWRGIGYAAMKKAGVRVKLSTTQGPKGEPEAIYFPYYNADYTKVIGFKKKNLLKDKSEKFHFTAIGAVNTQCPLFMQNIAPAPSKKPSKNGWTRPVIVTEGEVDALSMLQAYMTKHQGQDGEKFMPAFVSIQVGTPNAAESVGNADKFLSGYGEICFAFDNDSRKPTDPATVVRGVEATEAAAGAMSMYNLTTIKFDNDFKDANDYLKIGKIDRLCELISWGRTEYRPEKIVKLCDSFSQEEFFRPLSKGIYLPSYPLLMEKLLGIRFGKDQGELTLMLSGSGAGKSSVAADMAYEFARAFEELNPDEENCVGGIFLEEGKRKTWQRFAARHLQIHPNKLKFASEEYQTGEIGKNAMLWTHKNIIALDHFGSIPLSSLVGLTKMFILKYGTKLVVFDHISLAISGSDIDDERKALDKAMTEIAALCEETGAHVIVVCHINRTGSSPQPMKKNKNGDELPTWHRCLKEFARGSSGLEGLSWNIICIDQLMLPDGLRGPIRLFLAKSREVGDLGFCDILQMDDQTGIFKDASEFEKEWMELNAGGSDY